MTIKQYGSLTLDLNNIITIKPFKVKEWYSLYSGSYDFNLIDSYQVILKDKEIYIVNEGKQLYKDYQEFTLNKRNQVAKEAFDSVEKDNSNWILVKGDFESLYVELENYLNNQFVFINSRGEFYLYKNKAEETPLVKDKLKSFNRYSTDKEVWISYAQQIKDAYLDSLVDPVKVANHVLKSRKLDKEWVADNEWLHLKIKNLNNDHKILWGNNLESYSICHKEVNKYNYISPTTNSEWVKVIEFALDKYYELLKQSNEVDLKLMLDKALKDNGLVAKEIDINVNSDCPYKVTLLINNDKLKYLDLYTNQIAVYANQLDSPIGVYSYNNFTDWQTIFSNSLAQYKQLDKLRQSKLTKNDIIECLESALQESLLSEKLAVEHISGTLEDSLIGTIEVKLTQYKLLTWVIDKDCVVVRNPKGDCFSSLLYFYYLPNTKEKWKQLFINSLKHLLPVSKEPEPTLIDLIKKAFPSYNLHKSYTSELGNFIYYGCHKSLSLEVAYNSKLNAIELFTVKERKEGGEYYFSKGRDFFTKENLTNYTNWEQWLEDLIKLNQNLKDLEQSPNTVVSAVKQQFQRTKNLVSDNPADLYDSDLLETKNV